MSMDSQFSGFSGCINGLESGNEALFLNSDHFANVTSFVPYKDPNLGFDFNFQDNPLVLPGNSLSDALFWNSDQFANITAYKDPNFGLDFNSIGNSIGLPEPDLTNSVISSVTSGDEDSPSDDNEFPETLLNYISEMLMEEDMEVKPGMFHDPLALQAAERSFYDVIGEKYPPSKDRQPHHDDQLFVNNLDDGFSSSFSDYSSSGSVSTDHLWNSEFEEGRSSFMQKPVPSDFVFQSTAQSGSQSLSKLRNGITSNGSTFPGSSVRTIVHPTSILVPNMFNESDLASQFKRGVEEASKFLPKDNKLAIDLGTNRLSSDLKGLEPVLVVKEEKYDDEYMPNWSAVKKNHDREDADYEEERSYKQPAVYIDEIELAEMFDKTLVCVDKEDMCILHGTPQTESSQQNGQANGSNGAKTKAKREVNNREVVDLRTLLIQCAQAVSSADRRTANELLKQIRRHSSPFGDGSQRLAHYFANGLEARLAGTGTQIHTRLSAEKISAADMLKAYQAYISVCPFNKIALIFANHNIMKLGKKATTLHIIDFGILYGFQWPALIYRLSRRPGGPPKLRITGIELPQSGFRPAERVQDTGRRLARYCKLHNVPFEYNAIAQKWETIKLDDLKINSDEVVAVNCMFHFKNLLDETVVINNPRNAVLNLIKKANPDIFIHAIVNGSYNVPFFISRFREALFHFTALFDMCDTNMAREDQMRLKYEKEFYGREIMNVIACEGSERVERPEPYKQWQVRHTRAGLKPLPLYPLLVKKLKGKVKSRYHSDFMVDQDGNWMLQGWKGRTLYASSAWVRS